MKQTALHEALDTLVHVGNGEYKFTIPPSVCFGAVALGGFVLSFVHKASQDFTSKFPKSSKHQNVQQLSVNFFRPSLAAPVETIVRLEVASSNRAWSTLHFQTFQNNKPCTGGHIMLTDFTDKGQLSAPTSWQLQPPPQQVTIETLEADNDPSWISYLTPFQPNGFRHAQSYVRWHVPVNQPHPSYVDQWISPGWPQNGTSTTNSSWSDELVHFVCDNVFPTLPDILYPKGYRKPGATMYSDMIAAGRLQRKLRSEGKDDKILGEGLAIDEMIPWIISTISMSVEVKKALPKEGVRWLFARVKTPYLLDNRMVYDITLLDEGGDLVATSRQMMQVIPMSGKNAKKASASL